MKNIIKSKKMNILNSDDYKRGYNDGVADAKNGKERDRSNMGGSIKFFLHGTNALDTYIQGYNDGYSAGMLKKTLVNDTNDPDNINQLSTDNENNKGNTSNETNINNKIGNMNTNVQKYETSLRAIEQLNHLLVDQVCNHIVNIKGNMRGYVRALEQSGVAIEACTTYKNEYYQLDERLFKQLTHNIITRDLPQIKKYYDLIANNMYAATKRRHTPSLRQPINDTNPTITISVRISNFQSQAIQADALCAFINFLVDERNELITTIKDYLARINEMIIYGVPVEMSKNYYKNFYLPNKKILDEIINHLVNSDYPYLDKIFKETVSGLAAIDHTYTTNHKLM